MPADVDSETAANWARAMRAESRLAWAEAEIAQLRAALERARVALEWIKVKAADKRNPAISFVADKALRGEDFSPLR